VITSNGSRFLVVGWLYSTKRWFF